MHEQAELLGHARELVIGKNQRLERRLFPD
jgi:hypothetical protein